MVAGEPEPVFAVEDRDADGVPVRIYRPSPDPDLPVIVYFHGGGWTIGTVEQYDPIARQVANATDAIVVSLDYRLAPEHPFPAALDDCWQRAQLDGQERGELRRGPDAPRGRWATARAATSPQCARCSPATPAARPRDAGAHVSR